MGRKKKGLIIMREWVTIMDWGRCTAEKLGGEGGTSRRLRQKTSREGKEGRTRRGGQGPWKIYGAAALRKKDSRAKGS